MKKTIGERAAIAVLFILASLAVAHGAGALFGNGILVVMTQSGPVDLNIEIADSEASRTRGLMFRTELPQKRGMIFLFDTEQEIDMWMRNTYIPLDMVFIDKEWRVTHVVHDTEPLSTDIISSNGKALRVLEIGAGEAARIGIKPGDTAFLRRDP